MKPRVLSTLLGTTLTVLVGISAYAGIRNTQSPTSTAETIGVSLGGAAYDLQIFSDSRQPVLTEVATKFPVLRYEGLSAAKRQRAYLSLDVLDTGLDLGRKSVAVVDLPKDTPELVPSGDLYIEDFKSDEARKIDAESEYVLSARWSPKQDSVIAYVYTTDSNVSGIAVVDIETMKSTHFRSASILHEHVAWSDDGQSLFYFSREEESNDSDGYVVRDLVPAQSLIATGISLSNPTNWPSKLPVLNGTNSNDPGSDLQPFEVELNDGTRVRGDDLSGTSMLMFESRNGEIISRSVDRVISFTSNGIVLTREAYGDIELIFLDADGFEHQLLAITATTTYKLPMPDLLTTTDLTVTQSGASYSPSCRISNHTSTSSMAFAYDMVSQASLKSVTASAAGTVAYLYRDSICNSLAGIIKCPESYVAGCPTRNGGWGNTVIIQHADGKFTKYSHMKPGSVAPTAVSQSVAVGCQLGIQGHTGATATSQDKGCGDHLHFQRQGESGRDANSISVTFSDVTSNPLSCTTYRSGNFGSSCVFRRPTG